MATPRVFDLTVRIPGQRLEEKSRITRPRFGARARPAAARAVALKDRHKFKTEFDDEAKRNMFRHMHQQVA
jgi:hypothetical protein